MNGSMTAPVIAIALTTEQIDACFPVMSQLRPTIRREDFVTRVAELSAATGLTLAYLEDGGVKAVAVSHLRLACRRPLPRNRRPGDG